MRKLLFLLPLLAFISCSSDTDRVLKEQLINKGTQESPLFYYNGELFTGVEFDVYPNGELKSELHIQDGKYDGLLQNWYENGQLKFEGNVRNDTYDGICKEWRSDGTLKSEMFYSNGLKQTEKNWNENGELIREEDYEKERKALKKAMEALDDLMK